jgi:peptidoglycan glycosyltransferase
VVAIDPKSGRVRVMASNKPYDPNRIPEEYGELSQNRLETPLLNRAVQSVYPPGSTFKVVTAAAALENDVITPETTIAAPGTLIVETKPLSNDFDTSYPPVALDYALTNSINTWFAKVGEELGADALLETMREFGFGSKPPIDIPSDEVSASGVSGEIGLLGPGDAVDVGRVAIGQERLLASPLQMAMVAAAIANKGKLMKPQIWSRVVDPDGRVTEKLDPSVYNDPISAETATELTTAMEGVVNEGTGTNAAISGVAVAGKTGTAETPFNDSCGGGTDQNQAWFIGFAPADDPEVAIAATVECTTAFGGEIAAPIFRNVAEALLDGE